MHREGRVSYFLLDSGCILSIIYSGDRKKEEKMERGRQRYIQRVALGSTGSFGPAAALVNAALSAMVVYLLWFILLFIYSSCYYLSVIQVYT